MKRALLIFFALISTGTLRADFIVMKNGTCYDGEITSRKEGVAVIETVERIITVKETEIERVSEGVSLVELYHQKSEKAETAIDHLRLSDWCFKNNFRRAGYLERAIAKKMAPEFEIPGTEVKKEAPTDEEAEKQKETVRKTVAIKRNINKLRRHWFSDDAETYRKNLSEFTPEEKAPVLIDQLDHTEYEYWRFRSYIFSELKEVEGIDRQIFIDHILEEPSETVKQEMVSFLISDDESKKQLEDSMLKTLVSRDRDFDSHANAIAALGMMRSWRSVPHLLRRFTIIWGGGARSHFFIGNMNSYVKDVTPVVANGATSFDPEIDTYTTGVVLDVKIKSIERRIVSRTLQNITGYCLQSPEDWFSWWMDSGHKEYAQHMGVTPEDSE